MKRYAAKLLYQVRVMPNTRKRRLCEERIVVLGASDARSALAIVKRKAKQEQFAYKNSEGNNVLLEFVGILELLCLTPACEKDEVWYEIRERVSPMERRAQLIPCESELSAIVEDNIRDKPIEVKGKVLVYRPDFLEAALSEKTSSAAISRGRRRSSPKR